MSERPPALPEPSGTPTLPASTDPAYRPDDCECDGFRFTDLPCWVCVRAGFSRQAEAGD